MALRKTVRSRRLGKQLRRLREEARLSQDDLVGRVNDDQPKQRRLSTTHLSRLETGLARITPEQLDRVAEALQVDAEHRKTLEELRRRADERGWWQEYADIVSQDVEMLVEIGEDATTARSYDNAFIQGLLQTRSYAEAVIGSARAFVSPINIDRMADMRLRRQERLSDPDFEGLTAVMSEGALRTVVGGPDVMREQLQYLTEVVQRLPVTIHVLPFSAGALPGSDNFVLFGFPHELDGDVVYVDSETAQRIYEDRQAVRQCTYMFDAGLAQALPARESQDLIRAVLKELP
ncbi:Helix-turn-helix domain-containing protein [Actinopolyspora xinjiangensis]|uniref:Helix-turn-helix domain-containing protein n=1 Tax=Actinopolyspora xinjiangensis TaxID=405564 RepID=A0A1H0VVF8_9ACTN|nr:helix-turn-helix transcriptional regulator [Actinopolyspora xinjiangensis]SDP82135.1 Helix-turn-helix domain-containing protein [Actinopolyspora xinjiangensis]